VRVLGTTFNVNTFVTGKTTVSLREGKVQIETGSKVRLLQPGYTCNFGEGKILEEIPFDASNEPGWMTGYNIVDGLSVTDLAQLISRSFNIKVTVDSSAKHYHFKGFVDVNKPLNTTLANFEYTGVLHFYMDKDSVLHLN